MQVYEQAIELVRNQLLGVERLVTGTERLFVLKMLWALLCEYPDPSLYPPEIERPTMVRISERRGGFC